MAIFVATFFNLKPEVTKEQRNSIAKRGQELFEKRAHYGGERIAK